MTAFNKTHDILNYEGHYRVFSALFYVFTRVVFLPPTHTQNKIFRTVYSFLYIKWIPESTIVYVLFAFSKVTPDSTKKTNKQAKQQQKNEQPKPLNNNKTFVKWTDRLELEGCMEEG